MTHGLGRTDAIGGTGRTDAIGGTGRTDAIGGTGRTDAIGGTGRTDAIGGTGRTDAIGGTGRTDAIGGTGRTDAIGGTGRTDAIGGTGRTDAIGGTGRTDAIGGTGRTDAIGGTGRTDAIESVPRDPDFLGPVRAINLSEGSVDVLGREIEVTSATAVNGVLQDGAYVSVYGEIREDGSITAHSINVLSEPYVPGASEVVISGKVDAADSQIGRALVGGQSVDYTGAMWQDIQISTNDVVTLRGIQPVPDGTIIATDAETR